MTTPKHFHDELVRLALQAWDRASREHRPPMNTRFERDHFEREVRERMAQAAQAYALEVERPTGPAFAITGGDRLYTLDEMLAANVDDLFTRDWLERAEIGEILDPYQGEKVMRVR